MKPNKTKEIRKINISLNDEERKEVDEFIDELLKNKKINNGDFIKGGNWRLLQEVLHKRIDKILNEEKE